jgi:hypothetical protein
MIHHEPDREAQAGRARKSMCCRFVQRKRSPESVTWKLRISDSYELAENSSKQTDCDLLLMPDDAMRHIRLFQVRDLFLDQFYGQSADGIFQMCDLCRSDNRRCNRFLL